MFVLVSITCKVISHFLRVHEIISLHLCNLTSGFLGFFLPRNGKSTKKQSVEVCVQVSFRTFI